MMKSLFFCAGMSLVSVQLSAQTTNFSYTGTEQYIVVPPCATEVVITAKGAQGGNGLNGATGGLGGTITGTHAVTPGDTLFIYVGGQNGYNGGGTGGINGNSESLPAGPLAASGGGASDVRLNGHALTDRISVAGGGGGAANNGVWSGCQVAGPAGNGGDGGGMTGGTGGNGIGTPCNCGGGGGAGATGGTQVAGGIHGAYAGNTACLRSSWGPGTDGTLGLGGNGSTQYHNGTGGGGGGGGGYFGGGAGGNGSDTTPGGGGGGGSSFSGSMTAVTSTSGDNSGNGSVSITFNIVGSLADAPTAINGNTSMCEGDQVVYTIDPVVNATSYTWTVPAGVTINSGQGTTQLTVDANGIAGTGDLEVVSNNNCGASAATVISITVNANPVAVIQASDSTICVGDVVTLTNIGNGFPFWVATGETTTSIVVEPTFPTFYVLNVEDNGCTNADTLMIDVSPAPSVNLGQDASDCEMVTLDAGSAMEYDWNDNSSNQTLDVTQSGTYFVTTTDQFGCTASDTVEVTIFGLPNVSVQATTMNPCVNHPDVQLTGTPAGGTWSGPGLSSGDTFDPSVGAGLYILDYTYTDGNGCSNISQIGIQVDECLGIEENDIATILTFFPNPVSDELNILFNSDVSNVSIELFDAQGKVVLSKEYASALKGETKQIEVSELAEGAYTLRLKTTDIQLNSTVILKH